MSDTCPNCGSKKNTYQSGGPYTCGYATEGDKEWDSDLCELVQSRMAAARDAERDLIADWIEAQGGTMSEIPDNGQCKHGQWSWTGCEMCGLEETAKAIRNNEHRSNT